MIKTIFSIVARSILLYLICWLAIFKGPGSSTIVANARAESLNRLTPPIDYIDEFFINKDHPDKDKLDKCIYYHKKVVELIPAYRSDAYYMMGFCYEMAGEHGKAADAYERSLKGNPSFFWTYYNLGALYYDQHNYAKARYYFEKSTEQDTTLVPMILFASKVLKDVMISDKKRSYISPKELENAYQRAMVLTIICAQKMKDHQFMFASALNLVRREGSLQDTFLYLAGVGAYEMKMYDKAAQLLNQYVSHNPNHWEPFHYLALACQALGRDDVAKQCALQAERLKQSGKSLMVDFDHVEPRFF